MLQTVREILQSKYFFLLPLLEAVLITVFAKPLEGTVAFVCLICVLLIVSENTAVTLLPFSLFCMFVLKEYDSFDRFVKLWWLAIPLVIALLFHFLVYREHPKHSFLLYGVIAVAAAITLGGVGSISAEEYFTPASLYYICGLGIVMVLMHEMVSAKYHDRKRFVVSDYVASVFYATGIYATFMVFEEYLTRLDEVKAAGKLLDLQWSNNIATFLMIALPFAFYACKKHIWHLPVAVCMLAAMMLTGSRAALILGVVEYVLCTAVFFILDRRHWYWYLLVLCALGGMFVAFRTQFMTFFESAMLHFDNMESESRYQMALRSWTEFKQNPFFGSGLGATGRQDIYNPKKFAMNWYHSAPFQIFGSLGILGILGYGFLWFTRGKTFWEHRTVFGFTVLLSQLNLFAMSMVNPGFFCPFPYEFYMVLLFAVLARTELTPKKRSALS